MRVSRLQFYLNIAAWTELLEVTEAVSGDIGQDRSHAEHQQGDGTRPPVVHLEISHWQEIGQQSSNTKHNQ